MLSATFVYIALTLTVGRASVFTDPVQLNPRTRYDYVVVGSGPGGSTVAGRLSQDPSVKVLLIEAGVANQGVLMSEIPLFALELSPNTPYDWNYTTTAQPGLFNRSITYPRGKILGGSSSTNVMVQTRGSVDDFDRYAEISTDRGWSWSALFPYMLKNEHFVTPVDHHNIAGEISPAIHGTSGPLLITLPGAPTVLDSHVIQTTQELSEFPFTEDMNSGTSLGLGWVQQSTGLGSRSSSATAYVNPFTTRPNLDVLIQTQVTKLFQTGTEKGKPAFRGVQFAQSSSAPRFTLNATREVILSAGSIGTPQILMLSGIGPKAQLSKLGIKTIVDNEDVGQKLQDHPLLANQWQVNSSLTDDNLLRGQDPTEQNELIAQWQANKTGRLTDAPISQIGFFRLPSNSSIFKTVQDPSAGPRAGHYELLFLNFFASFDQPTPPAGNFMTIATVVVSPSSRGSVTLASADPFVFPTIDPGMLMSDFDIFTMREAVKAAQRFVAAPAWKDFVIGPAPGQFADAITDEEIEDWARNTTTTIWHPVGTAAMSPCNAKTGVTDPDLKVKGVVGLRVVDASVMPFVPAAHTQAPVYFFAERAADLIKLDRLTGRGFCS